MAIAPGKSMSALEVEQTHEVPIYSKRGLTITNGSGAILIDEQDREYIDCVAGIGVANIGHSHPRLIEAITDQASKLITCPEIFSNDTRARLLEKLIEITPADLDQIFLCNSGTEAVEAAIKFARISTGKHKILSAMRGFHGRTLGSLSATFNRKYREPFSPLVPGFEFVPFNKIDPLMDSITEDTAAIILEVVQGNGGIHIADVNYLLKVRELCDDNNIMLILDEVQTGFCRTGTMFAFEQFGIEPDILTMAKAMGGGVPVAACIVNSSKISVGNSLHGSTFGGNPIAAAAALSSINILESEDLDNQASELGEYFRLLLEEKVDSPLIRDVRQLGLMIGIELRTRVYPVLKQLQSRGILAGPAGSTVIRLLPPLVITRDQIDRVVDAIAEILDNMSS